MHAAVISILRDGKYVPLGRVWEDGRYEGDSTLKRTLEQSLQSLLSTEAPQHGQGMLNRVFERFNNGYLSVTISRE
jgi:hypothetical protein